MSTQCISSKFFTIKWNLQILQLTNVNKQVLWVINQKKLTVYINKKLGNRYLNFL